MFLTVTAARTPVWRVKYRFGRKEQLYTIGAYPAISLHAARTELDWVKTQLREGRDPGKTRALNRAATAVAVESAFASVTENWLTKRQPGWSQIHYDCGAGSHVQAHHCEGKLPQSLRGVRLATISRAYVRFATTLNRSSWGRF
jgi:hypothetical protein